MLLHNVYFWLREDLTATERDAFAKRVARLVELPPVRRGWTGVPAPTEDRGVIDNSFSFGLFLAFDDVLGHDEYQSHPEHLQFVDDNSRLWTRVQVYDVSA